MGNWKTDEWHGAYPSKWKGMIVPDAITHPAKFSSRLIRRIYDHMMQEGWLKAGDMVVDPFGGVALGALDAMRLGLRWRGMELEQRFAELGNQNIGFWNAKFSRMPGWCQDATLLQGDSRHLIEVLNGGDASVASPPYAGTPIVSFTDDKERTKTILAQLKENGYIEFDGKRYTENEWRAMNHGRIDGRTTKGAKKGSTGYSDAAVGSPPYSEARIGQESGQEHCGRGDQYGGGATPGQLGSMKADGFDLALSSPPYSETRFDGGMGMKEPGVGGIAPYSGERPNASASQRNQANLGNMKAEEFDAAVASPPFRQQSGGAHFPKGMEITDPGLISRHSAGNQASHGYGEADGQLANMPEGDFDATLSSPPYEAVQIASIPGSGTDIELRKKLRASGEWEGYNRDNKDNLGSNVGDDFWMAARQIVEQVYMVLRPGGHAVWVVKGFVKNKQLVDFPGQWRQLCEAVGFTMVHEHHAMLVHDKGTSHTLEGGTVHHQTESKSFFRRLAESKGSPRIDYETILCMVKGEA